MILDSVSVPCHFNSKKLPNSSSENKDVSLHLGVKLGERENHYLSFKANEHRLKAEGWEDNFSLVKGLPAAGIVSMIRAGEVDVVQFNANLPKRDLKKAGLYYEGIDLGPLVRKVSADAFYQQVDREFSNRIRLDGRNIMAMGFGPAVADIEMASLSEDKTKTYGGSAQVDLAFQRSITLLLAFSI